MSLRVRPLSFNLEPKKNKTVTANSSINSNMTHMIPKNSLNLSSIVPCNSILKSTILSHSKDVFFPSATFYTLRETLLHCPPWSLFPSPFCLPLSFSNLGPILPPNISTLTSSAPSCWRSLSKPSSKLELTSRFMYSGEKALHR